jgi:hypothetical protein
MFHVRQYLCRRDKACTADRSVPASVITYQRGAQKSSFIDAVVI